MAYCSVDDIIARMPEETVKKLTQNDKVSSGINTLIVNSAITDATAIIDNKLGQVYVLPISPTPGILLRVAIDLSIYFIYRNRFDNKVPEEVKEAYDDAISLLDQFKKGEEILHGATKVKPSLFVVLTNKAKEDVYFSKDLISRLL